MDGFEKALMWFKHLSAVETSKQVPVERNLTAKSHING